jgi:hypothetical protein
MFASLMKSILALLTVQSIAQPIVQPDARSSSLNLWNAPVSLVKTVFSKQPALSEAMRSQHQAVNWTNHPVSRAIATAKNSASQLQEKVAEWVSSTTTSAQETVASLTVGSAKPFQSAASQVKQTLDQTANGMTAFFQSTQSSVQTAIQGTVDGATTSTATFFQSLQSSSANFGAEVATGLEDSVETAAAFTLDKAGQAIAGASWLVVKGYLWVSRKVSTGAQQAMLESAGVETVAPDPTPVMNSAPQVGGWVLFAEVCGVLVFYAALAWYAYWVWQNLPYRPSHRTIRADFDPSRWIWWSKADPEAQPAIDSTHPDHSRNWRTLPYAEALRNLMSKVGSPSRTKGL